MRAPEQSRGEAEQQFGSRQLQASEADRFAARVMPLIRTLRATGITCLAGLACALDARGIPTARGGRWHVSTVRNVIRRVEAL